MHEHRGANLQPQPSIQQVAEYLGRLVGSAA
jgi:hypothetical protein